MNAVPYNRSYVFIVLRAVDLFVACLIWRDYDVTISSFTGLEMRKPKPRWWAKALNWFLNKCEKNHCELAIAADIERANTSLAILKGEQQP